MDDLKFERWKVDAEGSRWGVWEKFNACSP